VYRRYASLFFIAGCDSRDNELITLEIVHRYVEQMDKYYGNVCELDIIFNFQKAYFILDELLLAGEMQESSKKNVLRCIGQQDSLEDMEVSSALVPSNTSPLMPNPSPYAPMMSLTHVSPVRPRTTSLPRSCRRYDFVPTCLCTYLGVSMAYVEYARLYGLLLIVFLFITHRRQMLSRTGFISLELSERLLSNQYPTWIALHGATWLGVRTVRLAMRYTNSTPFVASLVLNISPRIASDRRRGRYHK
jgi:hypothetical protein